jgi:drug/metabolite transporter (DMT)-like permease
MGLMPVSALVLSYVLLGEDPEWWHAAGLALVLAGIALVVLDRRS